MPLRILVADDERPARQFLLSMLSEEPDVEVVGEAVNGAEAAELIEQLAPDLALLDLQMPEVDGLGVVRLLRRDRVPLVAFVTAYNEYAIRAFELNAVDYLLKPIEPARLRETLARARARIDESEPATENADRVRAAATQYFASTPTVLLRRIPVRKRDHIILLPAEEIASAVADGELLHLTTRTGDRYTITYRLKDLEARLDPAQFFRLSRGTVVSINLIEHVTPTHGGMYTVTMRSGARHEVSRIRARVLREQLLRL